MIIWECHLSQNLWLQEILKKKDQDESTRNGVAVWHSDGTYIKNSNTITMLNAKEVPIDGGEILIADLVSAYEGLEEELKKKFKI